jgi:folate-dependent phosphoribosylglycinamide formyltransferase PurN
MPKKWLIPSEDREKVRPVFNEDRLLKAAVILSGGGSTGEHLCGYVKEKTPEKLGFEVVLLYGDRKKGCGVLDIGAKYGIKAIATPRNFIQVPEPDRMINAFLARALTEYGVDVVASMGAGWAVDEQVYDPWLCVNDHPGDLRVGESGNRAYKGWHEEPIMKALLAGERTLHVTLNEMDQEMDEGRIWMVSDGVPVTESLEEIQELERTGKLKERAGQYQDMLKEVGDNKIMARTLECIAKRRFGFDFNGELCFDSFGPKDKGVEYKDTFRRR